MSCALTTALHAPSVPSFPPSLGCWPSLVECCLPACGPASAQGAGGTCMPMAADLQEACAMPCNPASFLGPFASRSLRSPLFSSGSNFTNKTDGSSGEPHRIPPSPPAHLHDHLPLSQWPPPVHTGHHPSLHPMALCLSPGSSVSPLLMDHTHV